MMRYRSKFQRASYPTIVVDPSDEGRVLEDKWRTWYERESWKRLVFHCYVREAQVSMTTLTNPSISYSELSLPLPEARELWFAKTAQEWKAVYLERGVVQDKRPPSVGDLLRDISLLSVNRMRLDVQYAISIYLHAFWNLILEYRSLSSVHRPRPNSVAGNAIVLLTTRHQELLQELLNFRLATSNWFNLGSTQENLVLNLLMMNLYVSLDDLQLFSGKEGEEQARRVYPVLQEWAASSAGRKSIWHAGQILRTAKHFPPGHLKDFYAVGVHHAALALWTYGILTRASRQRQLMQQQGQYSGLLDDPVYLDDVETPVQRQFLAHGRERPVIRGPALNHEGQAMECGVDDPRGCMELCQDVLRANFGALVGGVAGSSGQQQEALPAIVENMCVLIRQLGNAALAIGLS
jgi:hypothetical protein